MGQRDQGKQLVSSTVMAFSKISNLHLGRKAVVAGAWLVTMVSEIIVLIAQDAV